MAKKTFLEKIGVVSSISEETNENEVSFVQSEYNFSSVDDSHLEEISTSNLSINEIYEQFDLQDLTKSIFKINEFKTSLPNTLPVEVIKSSVLNILTVSGLQLTDLLEDSNKRVEALASVLNSTTQETINVITKKQDEIKELEAKIEACKTVINDSRLSQESQEKLVNEEINKIKEIVTFIN